MAINKWKNQPTHEFDLTEISTTELRKIIQKMNNTNAAGIDDIDMTMIN